jgi:hypothetical protein
MTLNLNEALRRCIYICQIDENDDLAVNEITNLLTQTAGIEILTNATAYREYYAIGYWFWLKTENNLVSGEGAKFDQNFEVTRRYLNLQGQIDEANPQIKVPDAWLVSRFLDKLQADSSGFYPGVLSFGV